MLKISTVQISLARKLWLCWWQTSYRYNCNIPAIVMNNGNEMPILGFGTWNSAKDLLVLEKQPKDDQLLEKKENSSQELWASHSDIAKAVSLAIDVGYRHIDCAQLHGNEKAIGEVIQKKIKDGVVKRDDLFITSKLWNTFHDPEHVSTACAQTLSDLGLDYVDMYLMHSPMSLKYGTALFPLTTEGRIDFGDVDFSETWKAMENLVDKKMCKNIGISNFNEEQIECLLSQCQIIPQTLQMEVHPYLAQEELIRYAKWNHISITTYAPSGVDKQHWLGKGGDLLEDYKVLQLAKKHERSPKQILLRYHVQLGLAPIAKSTNKQHMAEYINIFDFELSLEDMLNLESLNHNMRYFEFSG